MSLSRPYSYNGAGSVQGVGTLYAGLVLALLMVSIAIYAVEVYRAAIKNVREVQLVYEEARWMAVNANVTKDMVVLPKPVDVVVIDPHGIPHVAKNTRSVSIPWGTGNVKLYIVVKGPLHVVAADPLTKPVVAVATQLGTASDVLYNQTIDELRENISILSQEVLALRQQVENLSKRISVLAQGYIDPTLVALIDDTHVLLAYRGLALADYGYLSDYVPLASPSFRFYYSTPWDACAIDLNLTITYGGYKAIVRVKPASCNSFEIYINNRKIAAISDPAYGQQLKLNYPFNVGSKRCILDSVVFYLGEYIIIGGSGADVNYGLPIVSCTDSLTIFDFVKDWVGWSYSKGDEYRLRLRTTVMLPGVLADAILVEGRFREGPEYSPSAVSMYVIAYPGYGTEMNITNYFDEDPTRGDYYYLSVTGGVELGATSGGSEVYAASNLVLSWYGTTPALTLYRYVALNR